MGVRCPKCGNTDPATIWEDNFWSGCDKCKWSASCENALWVQNPNNPKEFVDAKTYDFEKDRYKDYSEW